MPHFTSVTDTELYRTTLVCSDCSLTVQYEHPYAYEPPRNEDAERTFRFHTRNGRYLNRCRTCERAHVRAWREQRRVVASSTTTFESLGIDRKFGVEMELIFGHNTSRGDIREALEAVGLDEWSVKSDGSLSSYGWEVVSPPLSGEEGFAEIRTACRALRGIGATPNRSCGLHVHHEVNDLSLEDFKRLVMSWTNNQTTIDQLVSPSRREGRNQYCKRITNNERQHIMDMESLQDIRRGRLGLSRYKTFNVAAYARYGTVEVRQHQGSVDAAKIISWIRFGQAIIEASRTEAVPAQATVPALMERLSSVLDAAAATFLAGRAALLDAARAGAEAVVEAVAETVHAVDIQHGSVPYIPIVNAAAPANSDIPF